MNKTTLLALALSVGMAGLAFAQSAKPGMVETTSKGQTLATPSGKTLYTFDKDTAGKSACTAACTALWPPFLASASATASGNWSIITRPDGAKQWAYNGKPLYTWTKDQKTGDVTGDGVKKVWHVAQP